MSLRADCAHCFGLCCVVPAFTAAADFAITKPAGHPCPHLTSTFRCGIHTDLRPRGFSGCTTYDCYGAGQKVSQVTFGGRDWRAHPSSAPQMFEVFPVMRHLHELLWHLTEAHALLPAGPLADEVATDLVDVEALTRLDPDAIVALDLAEVHQRINAVLVRASTLLREGAGPCADYRGADLIGRSLDDADLRGADLRGAMLVGATLRRADLRKADVTGADVRGADLSGADLSACLFLTQAQLDATSGDATTALHPSHHRPDHWVTA